MVHKVFYKNASKSHNYFSSLSSILVIFKCLGSYTDSYFYLHHLYIVTKPKRHKMINTIMIKKSCEIPLTTKYRPFWPLSSSHLVRNLVRGLISSPNPRSLGENVSSRNPRNIVRSRKVSRCSLPAELGIWISDGSGACLAARLTNHSTAFNRQCTGRTITEPLQTSDRDNILHSMERFSEKVFDCQVCRYVNRAENRWHCVQEADLV